MLRMFSDDEWRDRLVLFDVDHESFADCARKLSAALHVDDPACLFGDTRAVRRGTRARCRDARPDIALVV